jgi:hypothetical protein
MQPESVYKALDALSDEGYALTEAFIGTGPLAAKLEALFSYRSQLPLFENHHEYLVRELVWRIER